MRAATMMEADPASARGVSGRVLIGWDGSRPSAAAVRWGLDRAASNGQPVTVVHVVERGESIGDPDGLEAIVRAAAVSHPTTTVTTMTIEGSVVSGLVGAADRPDDLLVIGTHKTGYLQGRVQGSRSVQVAASMRTPFAVVPDVDRRFRRGVVVGVRDATDALHLALVARAEVARCGGDVLVVHAIGAEGRRPAGHHLAGSALLGEARSVAAADGHIARSRLVAREPLDALLDASRASALLVIGSSPWSARGRPLSTTVHDILLNVNAPTLVIPLRRDGEGTG